MPAVAESSNALVCTLMHPLQVHKAKLKGTGAVVAVKVQYPNSLNVMLTVSLCLPLLTCQCIHVMRNTYLHAFRAIVGVEQRPASMSSINLK